MANLGVLNANVRGIVQHKVLPVWSATNARPEAMVRDVRRIRSLKWWLAPSQYTGSDDGRIEGVITTGGVVTPDARVTLHFAPLGTEIARTYTDVNGVYKFGKNGVPVAINGSDLAAYYVVAEDPEESRNAVITDRITPYA